MTIGNRSTTKPKARIVSRLLDHRTRTLLNAVSTEPHGKALEAYLRAGLERRRP